LWAQNVTGNLTGTVADASGAVIPGATVVMKNQSSGDERRTVSNNDGFFSINAVQPGDYTVSVEAKGFQGWKQTGIHFDPGDRRNLSGISLQVGASTETVTISGSAESITPVDSGEKSVVISQKQIDNISIVGQNAAEFIKILPGFAMTGGTTNSGYDGQVQSTGSGPVGSFSANGQRTAALDITSDGAHVVDPGCNCGQAVNTVSDMTQEMKVLTSNFGAENSKGPVVISAVGKSGGSQFHGEAYLYARNGIMDSSNAYNNSLGTNVLTGQKLAPKPDTYYYYPGFNFGGPVLIPHTNFNHDRNKLFFFFAYEYYKQQTQNPALDVFQSFVPTQEMRNGNFSPSYISSYLGGTNPGYAVTGGATLSGTGYPGGIIPASKFDPFGVAQMKLYPMPNTDPKLNNGFNYISSTTHSDNMYQLRPRVDWSINDNTKLFVSYNMQRELNHDNSTTWWGTNPTVPYPTPLDQRNQSDSISVNLTKVFSPSLTNELVFTYTNLNVPFTFEDPSKVNPANLGLNFKHIFNNVKNYQLPQITGWGNGLANIIQPSGFESGSLYADKWLPTVADNISKVAGTHTMKFGFYWERTKNQQPASNNANGQLQYGGTWGTGATGNAYADMLTGIISGGYSETNFDPIIAMHYMPVSFYGQDSWKISRRLTLDYGMRFEHLGPWVDETGIGAAVFDPSKYNPNAKGTDLTGFEWHKINSAIPTSGTPSRLFFYEPRAGIAWDIFGTGKTVLRGGYGVYRYHDEQNVQAGALTVGSGSYSFSPTPPNGVPTTFAYIASVQPSAITPGSVTVLGLHDDEQPMTKSYSFTVSQRMPWASLFEASYVGSKSKYLSNWNNNFGSLNLIPYGTLFKDPSLFDPTTPGGAANLSPNTTPFKPYQLYQSIKEIRHNEYSNYNALQASWNKQSGRVNFLANYTFSKALGIRGEGGSNGVGDPTNLSNNYGVLPNDRTHVFNAAYSIQLPDFVHSNAIAKGVINGWQFSGITTAQSGSPLQAVQNANFNFSGFLAPGTVLPNGMIVPADNSNYTATQSVINGSPDISVQPVLTCDPRKGLQHNQFINGSCFASPTPGHNGSYIMPYIKGPAFFNSDLSLFKNFQISESKKLQFRFSAYNFMNHPLTSFSPAGGDNNLNLSLDKTGKLASGTDANGKSIPSRFGYADYLYGARSVQLALKFYF
jgi:hypothetical protein